MTEKYTIGEKVYEVPFSWDAVTFRKYLEWVNEWIMNMPSEVDLMTGEHPAHDIEFPIRMLSFQTDIPLDVLEACNIDGVSQISFGQSFWFDFETLNDLHINSIPKEYEVSIDEAPAKFMIEFVHGVNALNGKQPINLAPDLIKNYFGIDILDEPVTKYYGLATFFLTLSAVTGLKSSNKYNLSPQIATKLMQVLECLKVLEC